jgi:hypothetical protein
MGRDESMANRTAAASVTGSTRPCPVVRGSHSAFYKAVLLPRCKRAAEGSSYGDLIGCLQESVKLGRRDAEKFADHRHGPQSLSRTILTLKIHETMTKDLSLRQVQNNDHKNIFVLFGIDQNVFKSTVLAAPDPLHTSLCAV